MPRKDPEARKDYDKARYEALKGSLAPRTDYHREYKRTQRNAMSPEEKVAHAAYRAEWRTKHRDRLTAAAKVKRDARKDEINARRQEQRDANREHARSVAAAWQKANRDKCNYHAMKRHTKKLQATPAWLTPEQHKAIRDWYTLGAATGFEVDHIIPLQGKAVSGLNVPWNLQLLTRRDNISKGNRLPEIAA